MPEQVDGTPEEPTSRSDVLASLRDETGRGEWAIWADGIAAPTGARRVGWIAVQGGAPTLVFDGWIEPETLDAISEQFEDRNDVYGGAWDVMYADRWRHAWGTNAGTFRLIDRRGGRLEIGGGEVDFDPGPWWQHLFREARHVPTTDVRTARERTRYDGVINEVCLELRGGETIAVASRWNWGPIVDVGYDSLMHEMETGWARRLADDLRAQLGDRDADR